MYSLVRVGVPLTVPICAESHLSRLGLVIVYGYHYLQAKHRAAIAIADSVASRKKTDVACTGEALINSICSPFADAV